MNPKNAQSYLIRIKSTFRKKRQYWYNGCANQIYPAIYDSLGKEFRVLKAEYSWQNGLKISASSSNVIEKDHAEILCKV